MRMFDRFCSPISFSSAPTPGSCTSTPRKSSSGRCEAISAVVAPIPKPISSTRGAARPNTLFQSGCCGVKGTTNRGPSSSIARRWPVDTRPARVTKLRMRRRCKASSCGASVPVSAGWSSVSVEAGGSSSGRPASFGSWIIVDTATRVRAWRLAWRIARRCVCLRDTGRSSQARFARIAMHGRCHYKKAAFMGGGSCWILLMAQQEGGAGVASARKVAHPKRARPDGGRLEGGLQSASRLHFHNCDCHSYDLIAL